MPALRLLQERQERTRAVDYSPKIDIDQPLKIFLGRVFEAGAVSDASIVKQRV